MGRVIELLSADGFQLDAYLTIPKGKPKGGVVVVQEIFGVNEHIKAIVNDFAAEGYAALAPALFDRVEKGLALGLPIWIWWAFGLSISQTAIMAKWTWRRPNN